MILYEKPRLTWSGESCLVAEFGDGIDRELNALVHRCRRSLSAENPDWLVESVPTYRSLAVYVDEKADRGIVRDTLVRCLPERVEQNVEDTGELVEIPVCYGGEYGPDLGAVAEKAGITAGEVVSRHSGAEYYVYMLGFTPGFCYLGGMDQSLETPRLEEPRVRIPAGSVGIAGKQTGIYPIESPGGWRLIGRTPLDLFDPVRDPAVLVNAGMRLRFVPVSEEGYRALKAGETL